MAIPEKRKMAVNPTAIFGLIRLEQEGQLTEAVRWRERISLISSFK